MLIGSSNQYRMSKQPRRLTLADNSRLRFFSLSTARNPWAKASPSNPTFSTNFHCPSNPSPRALPVPSGLNSVLVRALGVQLEHREAFGVKGLAGGVARLNVDKEDFTIRRSVAYRHERMGMCTRLMLSSKVAWLAAHGKLACAFLLVRLATTRMTSQSMRALSSHRNLSRSL